MGKQISMACFFKIFFFSIFLGLSPKALGTFSFYVTRPSNTFKYLITEAPENSVDQFFTLNFQRLNAPVLSFTSESVNQKETYITDVNILEAALTKKFNDHWSMGADLATFDMKVGNNDSRTGINDLRVAVKHQLSSNPVFNFASLYEVYVPTGRSDLFLSSHEPGIGILGVTSYATNWLELSANVGIRYMSKAIYQKMDRSLQIPLRLGIYHQWPSKWGTSLESHTSLYPNNSNSTGEGEVIVNMTKSFDTIHLAFGGGLGSLETHPEWQYRLFAGLKINIERNQEIQIKTIELKTVEKIRDCSNQPLHLVFPARPLTEGELAQITLLPYHTKGTTKTVKLLNLGQLTGLSPKGIPYVKDSQVIAAFDMFELPPRKWVQKIQSSRLQLFAIKSSTEHTTRSEILCFLGINVCSGETFEHHDWISAINKNFFQGKETPNDYFSRQYLNQSLDNLPEEKLFAADLSLDLKRLLENSIHEVPIDMLYDPLFEKPDGKRTLFVVIADDTYVKSDMKLELSMTVNNCFEQNSEK